MARKAKATADAYTLGLPGIPARRGRPPTGKAQSGADRQRAYRARLRAEYREAKQHPEFPSPVTKTKDWDAAQ